MPQEIPARPLRSDARRNRDLLVDAARALFADRGHDVPLEDVAQAAGVSRTTLYRHFATREDLAATVFEDNVATIERRAEELREHPDGVRALFDFVLERQSVNRGLARMLSGEEIGWLTALSNRTAAAFEMLVAAARGSGVLRDGVDTADLMLAFAMAGGAFADDDVAGRERASVRVRSLLHRALFAE